MLISRLGLVLPAQLHVNVTGRSCMHVRVIRNSAGIDCEWMASANVSEITRSDDTG